MDEINKIPPVTRTLLGATLGVTLPTLLKLVNPYIFLLWWPAVFRHGHVWRPFTAFFFGGSGLQLLFDSFFLLRNSTELELGLFARQTADYAWALILVNSLIMVLNYPLRTTVLFRPMLAAILYLWSKANPHAQMSLFGLITLPAKIMPYVYIFMDLVQGGVPVAIQGATGLMAAHIFYFLKTVLPATNGGRGPNYLPSTPSFLRALLPDSQDPASRGQQPQQPGGSVRGTTWGGTAYAPPGRSFNTNFPQAGTGATSGGQRLNAQGSSGSGLRSWLPFGNRGTPSSRASSGSSSGRDRSSQIDRDAMLAAAEARLRAIRENSIAGRNEAARSQAQRASTAASEKKKTTDASAGTVLGSDAASNSNRTTGIQSGSDARPVRRTAAPSGAGAARLSDLRDDAEEQETASGSGGRVAEIRRAPRDKDADDVGDRPGSSNTTQQDESHSWGSGRKLGR